ncbi:MAG: aldehyde dehydrogenase family protein [Candidatus Sumerlaeota bacterium]
MDQSQIQSVVEEVVSRMLGNGGGAAPAAKTDGFESIKRPDTNDARAAVTVDHQPATPSPELGVFSSVNDAAKAAEKAFLAYKELKMDHRDKIVAAIRRTGHAFKKKWAPDTVKETGMGRTEHKVMKFNAVCDGTRGTEDLSTYAKTGDYGLMIEEMAPYGVVCAVTPSTHPVPTLINNSISLLAAGNSVVFAPHPAGKRVFAEALATMNREIIAAGGPPNLMTCLIEPTIDTTNEMFAHPLTRLLLVTGGPGVVKAALAMPKKAITAGPGNPPVVVDETADLKRAAKSIIDGGGFDNNILCIGEKEVFCVASVFDALMKEMEQQGCVRLSERESTALAEKAFEKKGEHYIVNRQFVGRNASVLAEAIGMRGVGDNVPLLFGEVNGAENIWVQEEQMMPFIPFVRVPNVDTAIELAIQAEHGYRHTACMHSTNLHNLSRMARLCDCSIFVKNGPSVAGLAVGGEGYISYSIASPTGEGITTAKTFTRKRRCTLVDAFRII